jgi:hypothetical protein
MNALFAAPKRGLAAFAPLAVLLAALLAALVAVPAASAAQLVVVESTVKGLSAGQVLDESTALQIPAGGQVTVISEDGRISKLTGPYSGKPAASLIDLGGGGGGNPGTVQALSRLFVSNQPSATSWGTFRGDETASTFRGGDPTAPAEIWAVDVRRSETACVPAGGSLTLWRPDAGEPLDIILLHIASGREATLAFAAAVQGLSWPAAVPMLDGGEYAIRDTSNRWERRLSLRIIPTDRAGQVDQAAWMSDAGCFRQARAMLAQAL